VGPQRILIADDSAVARAVVTRALQGDGRELVVVENGDEAIAALEATDAPWLAVLDWEMPGLTGPEVCARARELELPVSPYLILLTSRNHTSDTVAGLLAGADDYLTKPFEAVELQARVRAGERVLELQRRLAARVSELEEALTKVDRLEGLLPICSYCKKVRDDTNYWHQVESYVAAHSRAQFSHGVCPECFEIHLKPFLDDPPV
jgi:DNA-binding response OmpR family regulator